MGIDAGDDYRTAQGLAGTVGDWCSSLHMLSIVFSYFLEVQKAGPREIRLSDCQNFTSCYPRGGPPHLCNAGGYLAFQLCYAGDQFLYKAVKLEPFFRHLSPKPCFPGGVASVFIPEVGDIHDLWQRRRILEGTPRAVGQAHYGGKLHAAGVW